MAQNIKHTCDSSAPYVFISYSRKNENIILPIVHKLMQSGHNIWIDTKSIRTGQLWRKAIVNAIINEHCQGVIVFLSDAYQQSKYCIRELKIADKYNKAIIPVLWENQELDSGLLTCFDEDVQNLCITADHDPSVLADKLSDAAILKSCNLPISHHAEFQASPTASENAPVPSEDKPVRDHKTPLSSKVRKTKQPHNKRKLFRISLALLVMFCLLLAGRNLFGTSPETHITITDQTIDGRYWKDLQRMKKLESIQFQNCTFTADIADSGTLTETLQSFTANHCDGIEYLDMLAEQDGITSLALTNCNALSYELNFHFPASLTSVDLSGNTHLTSVNCLVNCTNLKQLDLSKTAVDSLTSLTMDALETLDISRTKLRNLSYLSNTPNLTRFLGEGCSFISIKQLTMLEHLTEIDLSDCALSLLNSEFMSLRLKRLDLSGNAISNIDALTNCTILEDVDLSGNMISNIDVLSKSAATLKKLKLSGNPISQEAVSALLKQCSKLTELCLDGIPLCAPEDSAELNLTSISHLLELQTLSLSGCNLYNIGGILPLRKLTYLDLSNNHLSELKQFPAQESRLDLNLMNNPCTSISGLMTTKYDIMVLYDPEPEILHLPASLTGSNLLVSGNVDPQDLIQVAPNFYHIYIVDYPLDKRVALEDSIGAYNLSWITEKDIPALLSEWNM